MRIQKVVYQEDSFRVLRVKSLEDAEAFTASGNLYGLLQVQSGSVLGLSGSWKRHPKYGRQFAIKSWFPSAEEPSDVSRFLSVCVGMMDWGLISRLADLGGEVFDILSDPDLVLKHAKGSSGAAQSASLKWVTAIAQRDLSSLLGSGGLSASDIYLTRNRFGSDAASVVKENPYRLLEVLSDFPKVDKLAMRAGFDSEDIRRVEGAVLWAMREESRDGGHLFIRRGDIPSTISKLFSRECLISIPDNLVAEATSNLVSRKALVSEDGVGAYLPLLWDYERRSSDMLTKLLLPSEINLDFDSFLESYEKSNRIRLSESQREAVEQLGRNRVLVLTGLPGTGKSTSVRALVQLFREARLSFSLMAPTGIAAKRLAAMTSQVASTVHRALGYDGVTWRHHKDNRYIVDAVVVDEVSMVDQELFFRLLSALLPGTMLVLVGDDAQLPSVGPGNVLRELVASGIPHVRLTQIFRQSEKGEIVTNSHRINGGEMPVLAEAKGDSEFKFVRISDEEKVADLIVNMAKKLKSRDANFQVLAPKYKGPVGVDALNQALRECLNPSGPKEWSRGGVKFRLGDRLMVVQNDYVLGVYNGDMGKLVKIGRDSLTLKIHGIGQGDLDVLVEFSPEAAAAKLKLAYAISIHRSQGGEFDTVILPVVRSQGRMLQRNLLYTAVTRARRQVWILGEETAIQKAVDNNPAIRRNTVLARAIGVHTEHDQQPRQPSP